MTDKQIIIDGVSNFCLVCYYDNRTNELVRVEHYEDNSGDIKSNTDRYKYGYNVEIIKPEKIIKQLKLKEQKIVEVFAKAYELWMFHIANGINNDSNQNVQYLLEDLATITKKLSRLSGIKNGTLEYYTQHIEVGNE